MTLKNDAKFEEKLTCSLENDMRNLANFYQSTWKCQSWEFDGILLSKVENAWAKNLQRIHILTLKNDENSKRNWLVISKLTWGIWRFLTRALKSLKNLHCIGLLMTKVYNVWGEKVQKSYLTLDLRMIHNMKKNWLVVWEMTWGIWRILTRALESVKIGTLIDFGLCPK